MSSNGNGNGKSKLLIVNADDYGWSRGITDGILKAHHDGIVTSTSMMVNRPAGDYALSQLPSAPKLGVGIHLTLSDGAPVLPASEVPTLVDSQGNFYSGKEVLRRLRKRMFSPREIEAEFRAQIRWMKERGLTPTHADSHQHLHLYPVALYAFHRALKAEGIRRVRPPRNRYCSRHHQVGGRHGGAFHRQLIVSAYMAYIHNLVFSGMTIPDWRLVFPPIYRGRPECLAEAMQDTLENLGYGSWEMTCHPAFEEPGFSEKDPIRKERQVEMKEITGQIYKDLIASRNIKLITYAEL